MIGPRHEKASLQSIFYRIQFHKVLRWINYSLFIIFLLILGILYLIFDQPQQSYYGNTPEGKILPMPMTSRGS